MKKFGTMAPFREVKFSDHEFAQWLRKYGAIDYFEIHHDLHPVYGQPYNVWFDSAEKTNCIAFAIYDNARCTDRKFVKLAPPEDLEKIIHDAIKE